MNLCCCVFAVVQVGDSEVSGAENGTLVNWVAIAANSHSSQNNDFLFTADAVNTSYNNFHLLLNNIWGSSQNFEIHTFWD